MSASATIRIPRLVDPRDRRVLRYAFGSTLAMAIAMGVAWELSFLVPVLSLSFLAAPGPPPSFRKGLAFVGVIAVSCVAGLYTIKYFLAIPVVFLLVFWIILLRLYYMKGGGASPFLITWLLIALLVLPLVASQSPELAKFIAVGIIEGAAVTLFVVWIAYALIPDPPAMTGARVEAPAKAVIGPPRDRFGIALTQALVVFPLYVLFHVFQWTGAVLVLVFTAILSMQPAFAASFKSGVPLILGNFIGGMTAIVMFQALTVVPQFSFLILVTLLAGLCFGARLMSESKTAPLFGMAYSTLLLVIGSVTTSSDGDAASKVYERLIQIMLAVVYVVVAFKAINGLRRFGRA